MVLFYNQIKDEKTPDKVTATKNPPIISLYKGQKVNTLP